MKVQIKNEEYTVRFNHVRSNNTFTECVVEISGVPYGEGMAILSEGDRFVKEKGRKLSLKRALKSAQVNDKQTRKAIWDNYHISTNKKERIK